MKSEKKKNYIDAVTTDYFKYSYVLETVIYISMFLLEIADYLQIFYASYVLFDK